MCNTLEWIVEAFYHPHVNLAEDSRAKIEGDKDEK
jgi:hypothetical protein